MPPNSPRLKATSLKKKTFYLPLADLESGSTNHNTNTRSDGLFRQSPPPNDVKRDPMTRPTNGLCIRPQPEQCLQDSLCEKRLRQSPDKRVMVFCAPKGKNGIKSDCKQGAVGREVARRRRKTPKFCARSKCPMTSKFICREKPH